MVTGASVRTVTTAVAFAAALAPAGAASVTAVSIDASEARASLAILSLEQRGRTPADSDWAALFATPGYTLLKQREASFHRGFGDDDFRAFLREPAVVASADRLRATLDAWSTADLSVMEARARAYLPDGANLRATVYPLIKPRTNSFVYQLDTNPAIMLYLDPTQTPGQFSNTVSHELLHVGDSENCPPPDVARSEQAFDARQKTFATWLSAFGEGWAVLAAAGGPNVDPHQEDPQTDRDRWNAQMKRFDADFADLEAFYSSIASGALSGDAATTKGMSYFGAFQGPWYTVGYRMDVTIETVLGRPALIAALCDKRHYLATYDAAAARLHARGAPPLPLWDGALAHFLDDAASPDPSRP